MDFSRLIAEEIVLMWNNEISPTLYSDMFL